MPAAAPPGQSPSLADLRVEIDRIDEAMHRLLMERGAIIDTLIRVKGTQVSCSSFRPAREAEVMRKLVERHEGILPLDTVESIWRVIAATFTHVQAPFAVHADLTPGDAAMRDSARFHFGFTVPLVPHAGAAQVVKAITASKGDLGLVPATAVAGDGAWWTLLERDDTPKIIARLPFIERPDHPASLQVFAVARPADAVINEVETWSVRVSGWNAAASRAITPLADVIAVPDGAYDGAALLISVPHGQKLSEITGPMVKAGASVRSSALVGGHAARYTVTARDARPVATAR